MDKNKKINRTEKVMVVLAEAVNGILSKFFNEIGFVILVFDFNDSKEVNYISNAKRDSIIKAFKDGIKQLEKNEEEKLLSVKELLDDNEKNTEKTKKA